jgi:hypothetical protein
MVRQEPRASQPSEHFDRYEAPFGVFLGKENFDQFTVPGNVCEEPRTKKALSSNFFTINFIPLSTNTLSKLFNMLHIHERAA